MIVTSTVGKIDAVIGRFETPLLGFMEKTESDLAKKSLKNTFYNVMKSKHYAEAIASMTGIGDWKAGKEVDFDTIEEGYSKQFVHTIFRKGIEIDRETIDDSRLIDMKSQAGNLIDSYHRTVEKFIHAPFNYCTQSSFNLAGGTFNATGADGQPLASDNHPSKTGKAPAQSNLTTLELTADNLLLAEEKMNSFLDDIGEKSNIVPDTIIVPYELRSQAFELVGSEGKVGTNYNDINVFYGKYNVIVSRWLTNPKVWFLVDSSYLKRSFYFLERVPLEIDSQLDKEKQTWKIMGYSRFSLGFVDWRAVLCNVPAGA